MKNNLCKGIFFFVFLSFFAVSCDNENNEEPEEQTNIVYIEDDIYDVTTWYSDSIYVIKAWDFYVMNSLTIQPGTIIKFHPDGAFLMLGSGGTINAKGTASRHIIFTSWKDDSAGGDTNGDGNASNPSVGDWGMISTNSENGSVFEYCEFHYGGGSAYTSTLEVYGNNISVKNCLFANNSGADGSGWYGALEATYGGPACVITGNIFYNNIRPLSVGTVYSIDDSNIFHNPADAGIKNTYNAIFVYSGEEIKSHISWEEDEVPFVIDDNDFWIYNGSLTLADQVVLKFRSGSAMVLDGGPDDIINHDGPGVYFTSYKDDSKKGDTNGDGDASSPSAGDWLGIHDNLNSIDLAWANILYAGEK